MTKTIEFNFNRQKAIEAILYFTNHKNDLSVMHLLKFLFYSDLYHLNQYGRPILGDLYFAMDNGPVASNSYDMLKNSTLDYELFRKPHSTINYVRPLRKANLDYFSDTDIEIFDNVLDKFKELNAKEMSQETHKTKAWDKAWKNKNPFSRRSRMSYEDFFETINPETINHLKEYGTLMVF